MLRVLHHTTIDLRMKRHLHLRHIAHNRRLQNDDSNKKYQLKRQLSSLVSATAEQSSNSVIMKMFNMIRSFRNRGDHQTHMLSWIL